VLFRSPSSDPETRRMNRCTTAGRLPSTCLGNTMEEHFFGKANSILSSMAPDVVGKETTGPQMAGAFEGKGDWRLEFVEASVLMICAGLHPEQHTYSIALTNNRAVISIQSTPKPVVLTISRETGQMRYQDLAGTVNAFARCNQAMFVLPVFM
jgi:hypothetical protein